MSIAELRLTNGLVFDPRQATDVNLPDAFHDLVEFGLLASAPEPFDPMDKAFHELGRARLAGTEHLHDAEWKLAHAYGLRPDLLAMSQVWQGTGDPQKFVVATKGAPEAIADLCHLSTEDRAALTGHRSWPSGRHRSQHRRHRGRPDGQLLWLSPGSLR